MHLPTALHVGTPVVPKTGSEVLAAHSKLRSRADSNGGGIGSTGIIVAAVVVGIIVIVAMSILIRALRSRHPNPKYIPTPFLKRLWTNWKVPVYRTKYSQAGSTDEDGESNQRRTRMREAQDNLEDSLATAQAASNRQSTVSGVDRNTSVRSVMTLPAYRQKPTETEQVLGREGERDGIDTVVELPTAEEDEALREEEMEALYQIRLARRRQIAEREERRRLRREARERRDNVALDDLREQARSATSNNQGEVDDLRQSHERVKQTRQRAVSSVSYADLGVARHDGTRIRANSTESERVGLLSDAASISQSITAPADDLQHRRAPSASSVLSIDTFRSNELGSPGLTTTRSRTSSVAHTPRRDSTRAGSSPELIDAPEADLGDADMPPHSPPGYDEVSLNDVTPVHSRSGANSPYNEPPPDYPGPTQARNERLSAHVADLVAETSTEGDTVSRRSSRGVGGVPQLPSLRLNRLPEIHIEPASALPQEEER